MAEPLFEYRCELFLGDFMDAKFRFVDLHAVFAAWLTQQASQRWELVQAAPFEPIPREVGEQGPGFGREVILRRPT